MAEHTIVFNVPKLELINKDMEVVVRADGKKLGTLLISKGTIGWLPVGKQKKSALHRSWSEFAAKFGSD